MPREPVNGQQLTAALRACSAAGSTVRVGERAARDRQGPCPRGADDLVGVACVLGRFGPIQLCAALWTVARQAPLSLGFSRQECWSGFLFLLHCQTLSLSKSDMEQYLLCTPYWPMHSEQVT